jgi:hypothetical protein
MTRAELMARLHQMQADFQKSADEARAEEAHREANWYLRDVATIEAAIAELNADAKRAGAV